MIRRQQPTHVRYEPDIEGGTTYAFSYPVGDLVIGRRPMWEMIRFIESTECDLDNLMEDMVADHSEQKYEDAAGLLTDLTRLVDAGVIRVERGQP